MRWGLALLVVGACATRAVPGVFEPPVRASELDAHARSWALRGFRAELLGDLEEAERSWQWARRYDPGASLHQAGFFARIGRLAEAETAYLEVLSTDPTNGRAKVGIARLRASSGADPEPWLEGVNEPCLEVFVPGDSVAPSVARCRAR